MYSRRLFAAGVSYRVFVSNVLKTRMASRFQVVEQGPPIEVFQLMKFFSEDTYQHKVNLSVGGM